MLDYRSWGRSENENRLPSGKTSEKRFEDDHDWYRKGEPWRKKNGRFHPERVVFGLPHNYSKKPIDHVIAQDHERRASPLLFHVHQFGNQYVGVAIFLKSRFLPEGEKIKAGEKCVEPDIHWRVITDFLDGKVGNPPGTNAEYRFPESEREVVFPWK